MLRMLMLNFCREFMLKMGKLISMVLFATTDEVCLKSLPNSSNSRELSVIDFRFFRDLFLS